MTRTAALAQEWQHTYIGDLAITLIPPNSIGLSQIVLHNRAGGRRRDIDQQFSAATTPALKALVGKSCKGRWTFRVEDKAAQDSGMLIQTELQLSIPPKERNSTTAPLSSTAKGGKAKAVAKKKHAAGKRKPVSTKKKKR